MPANACLCPLARAIPTILRLFPPFARERVPTRALCKRLYAPRVIPSCFFRMPTLAVSGNRATSAGSKAAALKALLVSLHSHRGRSLVQDLPLPMHRAAPRIDNGSGAKPSGSAIRSHRATPSQQLQHRRAPPPQHRAPPSRATIAAHRPPPKRPSFEGNKAVRPSSVTPTLPTAGESPRELTAGASAAPSTHAPPPARAAAAIDSRFVGQLRQSFERAQNDARALLAAQVHGIEPPRGLPWHEKMVASPAVRAMLHASRQRLIGEVGAAREEAKGSTQDTKNLDQLYGLMPQGARASVRARVCARTCARAFDRHACAWLHTPTQRAPHLCARSARCPGSMCL